MYSALHAPGSPYLHVREQSTHTPLSEQKGTDSRTGVGSLAAQLHNGGRLTVARRRLPITTPPTPAPQAPLKPKVRPLPALSLLPCSRGDSATAPRGALPHSRFPPPLLGSRKTRSELALSGSACSVASRFSSLVGSSSATPASAAAAAAPQGNQIPQQRPRAFPLPR